MHRLKPLIIVFVATFASGLLAQAQDKCSEKALPPQARLLIQKKFSGWRVKLTSDLDDFDRRDWDQYHPGECPGLAIGHFEDSRQLAYGVLLVPKSSAGIGYKMAVLAKSEAGGDYLVRMVDQDRGSNSGLVISKVRPGKYTGFDTTQSVRLKLDGIEAEWIEKASVLYYYRNGKYQTLATSD